MNWRQETRRAVLELANNQSGSIALAIIASLSILAS